MDVLWCKEEFPVTFVTSDLGWIVVHNGTQQKDAVWTDGGGVIQRDLSSNPAALTSLRQSSGEILHLNIPSNPSALTLLQHSYEGVLQLNLFSCTPTLPPLK